MDNLGERMSGLEVKVASMDRYAHEKWHDLNNTLQPLVQLPERLTRDMSRIQGGFEGRIGALTKEIERSITAVVEKALEPVNADLADLRYDVDELKADRERRDGASTVLQTILRSPVIAWIVVVAGAVWAVLTGKIQP